MNLSGIIFHIEEDAYDKLNKYLATIRSYFKDSEGRDEIMSDIEARVAEMLQEKVSNTKQAILMMDVESVIALMGKPEDFAGDSEQQQQQSRETVNDNTFSNGTRRRRIFRDPDDKKLGGVCSGIANYFDFDPIWLRLAFVVCFFAYGSGFLLYIILWIIIPEAKTTAEKLEMRGEKVDINNISKAVNEEFEEFKSRVKNFGGEVGSKENKDRVKSTVNRGIDFIGDVLYNIIRVLGKIAAVFLVFIGIALMMGLLATIFGKGTISVFNGAGNNLHFSLYEISSAVLPADLPVGLVVLGLLLFFGVPLLSIIYGCIKYLFGIRQKNKIVKYTANILWLSGLALVVYIAIVIGSDFNDQASNKQKLEIKQPGDTLYLDVNKTLDYNEEDYDLNNYSYSNHNRVYFGDWLLIAKNDNKFRIGYPEMNIVMSETDSFELVAIRTANGFDKKDAANRAKSIDYSFSQTDSALFFNPYFDIKSDNKLRAQDLKLILKVPLNKVIFLSKRMEKIIFDIDNVEDAMDSDMVNRRWIMTKQGLKCLDCDGLEVSTKEKELEIPPPPPVPEHKI